MPFTNNAFYFTVVLVTYRATKKGHTLYGYKTFSLCA